MANKNTTQEVYSEDKMLDKMLFEFAEVHSGLSLRLIKSFLYYLKMAYTLGYNSAEDHRFKGQAVPIIRDDGVKYESASKAAKVNGFDYASLTRAIRLRKEYKGYYWRKAA